VAGCAEGAHEAKLNLRLAGVSSVSRRNQNVRELRKFLKPITTILKEHEARVSVGAEGPSVIMCSDCNLRGMTGNEEALLDASRRLASWVVPRVSPIGKV
jgi:hypothetical protein